MRCFWFWDSNNFFVVFLRGLLTNDTLSVVISSSTLLLLLLVCALQNLNWLGCYLRRLFVCFWINNVGLGYTILPVKMNIDLLAGKYVNKIEIYNSKKSEVTSHTELNFNILEIFYLCSCNIARATMMIPKKSSASKSSWTISTRLPSTINCMRVVRCRINWHSTSTPICCIMNSQLWTVTTKLD